jgi:protein-disulfide isomerase/uncharacterized membrane protein
MSVKLLKLNIVLYLIAAGIAGYMVWHHYALVNGELGFTSFCSINKTVNCDVVNASKYSEILGIPLATWGLTYYLFGLIVSVIGARNAYFRRECLLLLTVLSASSVVVSIGSIVVMGGVLGAYCIMCFSLHALDLAIFVSTVLAMRDFARQSGFRVELHAANRRRIAAFAVGGTLLLLGTYGLTAQLKHEMPFDEDAFINELRARPPQTIDVGDSPRQGFQGSNPPLQLVEFADFQCPACGAAARQMHRLINVYSDRVQLVFKNFPLDPSCNRHITNRIHDFACLGAKAAFCANKQGKFVDYYEKLFGNQAAIHPDKTSEWATELGLDRAAFEACIISPEAQASIDRDADLAASLGLESTPTFFANGRRVEGVIDERKLKVLIHELAK